jgi:hypothetical protein
MNTIQNLISELLELSQNQIQAIYNESLNHIGDQSWDSLHIATKIILS